MFKLGTRFWPPGPETVDWQVSLADGSFGPLRLGSRADEVKAALGRPDFTQWFGTPLVLFYERFGLTISLNRAGLLYDFQLDMMERHENEACNEDSEDSKNAPGTSRVPESPFANEVTRFDPLIKLPGTSAQRLRRLRLADFTGALGGSGLAEPDINEFREWRRPGFFIYLDLSDDGESILSVGWALPEE